MNNKNVPIRSPQVTADAVLSGAIQSTYVTVDTVLKLNGITTTQRNALTAANGMLIYNSTDNKFQGYQGGSWTNLA
tara:strand:- start:3555 stop:3782 length:228 start_codon:yes stop_codon:yes gene_type:complete